MGEPEKFLPTTPGTQMRWDVQMRAKPCLRCRVRILFGRGKKHFGCPPYPIFVRYVDGR